MIYDLTDLLDLHIHTRPDVQPRMLDDIQAATAAKTAGMRAILIKSHVVPTAGRACIAERTVGGVRVFGALVLNQEVGGFNPAAVETAIRMGAKVIWMPTRSAKNMHRRAGRRGGLTVFRRDGSIAPIIHQILQLIREANIVLATGHLSASESVALVSLANAAGLRKIVVTHPEAEFIRMPTSTQAELAAHGVYFERCFVDTLPSMDCATSIEEISAQIRALGCRSTVLSTDLGQPGNPEPIEGLSSYLASLATTGFTQSEIFQMAGENPAFLMDL